MNETINTIIEIVVASCCGGYYGPKIFRYILNNLINKK
jgi:hypothetical protein